MARSRVPAAHLGARPSTTAPQQMKIFSERSTELQLSPSGVSKYAFIIASTPCSCVGVGDQHSGIVRLFEVV